MEQLLLNEFWFPASVRTGFFKNDKWMDSSIRAGWLGSVGAKIHPKKIAETAANNLKSDLK